MIGADTWEGVGLPVVWQANMAHLGMQQAVHQSVVAKATTTDSSTHGKVDERGQALSGTPMPFTQCGGVHVSIEANRHSERTPDSSNYVGLRPARFGCRGNVAIVRRMGIG